MRDGRWSIAVRSDLQVVRIDPEYADMDHPNGEIIGEVFYLIATNSRGVRRAFGSFNSESDADSYIPFAPSVLLWQEERPEYGSVAYQNYGEDDQRHSESEQEAAARSGIDTRFLRF